jgi:transposase
MDNPQRWDQAISVLAERLSLDELKTLCARLGVPFDDLAGENSRASKARELVLATTHLDEDLFPPQRLLDEYKGQVRVERGFRFLKDPQFLASALFLKSPQRVMALLMVMTVCLLVYAALEWRIRSALQHQNQTFPNQKGQLIRNPTARWVFHFFVGIHLLIRSTDTPWFSISNLLTLHYWHYLALLISPFISIRRV